MVSTLLDAFTIQFHESNNGDFLLLLPTLIMIFGGSTRRLKHSVYVEESVDDGGCDAIEIYVESIVNTLTISDQGGRIQNHLAENYA
ncbi:hypothetical protein RDI58_012656 [Solanum bulbocastanum]|uniref:Uncharacterized protein n=1 Tax=Solanum bulbocastanum TaxID=147425 RepID=A0AAN8TQ68_SOLBU